MLPVWLQFVEPSRSGQWRWRTFGEAFQIKLEDVCCIMYTVVTERKMWKVSNIASNHFLTHTKCMSLHYDGHIIFMSFYVLCLLAFHFYHCFSFKDFWVSKFSVKLNLKWFNLTSTFHAHYNWDSTLTFSKENFWSQIVESPMTVRSRKTFVFHEIS